MLRQENKKIILYFIFILFLIGCNKKYKTYNTKEINKLRNNIVAMSEAIVSTEQYLLLYDSLNDSINNWIDNHIPYIEGYNIDREWLLDSIICINYSGNKLITSVLKKSLYDGEILN